MTELINKSNPEINKFVKYVKGICSQNKCEDCVFGVEDKANTCNLLNTPAYIKCKYELNNSYGDTLNKIIYTCKHSECEYCTLCNRKDDICYITQMLHVVNFCKL